MHEQHNDEGTDSYHVTKVKPRISLIGLRLFLKSHNNPCLSKSLMDYQFISKRKVKGFNISTTRSWPAHGIMNISQDCTSPFSYQSRLGNNLNSHFVIANLFLRKGKA
jgi:hypothetical protein